MKTLLRCILSCRMQCLRAWRRLLKCSSKLHILPYMSHIVVSYKGTSCRNQMWTYLDDAYVFWQTTWNLQSCCKSAIKLKLDKTFCLQKILSLNFGGSQKWNSSAKTWTMSWTVHLSLPGPSVWSSVRGAMAGKGFRSRSALLVTGQSYLYKLEFMWICWPVCELSNR